MKVIKKCLYCGKDIISLAPNIKYCNKLCYNKKHYIDKKSVILGHCKKYRDNNKDKIKLIHNKWYKSNKDKIKAYYADSEVRKRATSRSNIWAKNNRDKINTYRKEKYKNDIYNRLSRQLRNRLNCALRDNAKAGSAIKDLGCSIEEFKKYIESKWQSGMSWDNHKHNGWHIDHKIPLTYYDLGNSEQIKKACHYMNLQPMWANPNNSKNNKILKENFNQHNSINNEHIIYAGQQGEL